MNNLKLAWRNLWRNRRRTLITSASIFFAVFFALIMRSIQLGTYDHMYKNVIESYTGYIQVQQKDFWDEKIIDNTFPAEAPMDKCILDDKNVAATVPRLESFALASNGPTSKGVIVMGVDPEKEKYLSKVSDKLVKYRLSPAAIKKIKAEVNIPEKVGEMLSLLENKSYSSSSRLQLDLDLEDKEASEVLPLIEKYSKFENGSIRMGEPGVWLGDKLSEYLHLGIGDTIVLISQGYHGSTACKVTVFFRGREMAHKDRGQVILDRVVEMLTDVAKVEQTSRVEGRTMFLLMAGLPKK